MIWFTADTHFGHEAIIRYCHRKFASVHDMDEYILNRVNMCVKPQDTLYHLGDFAFGNWREYRDRINCKHVHLIAGNHDSSSQLKKAAKEGLFDSISFYVRLKIGKENASTYLRVIMCHYPIHSWQPGFVHLHGHSHGCLLPGVDGRKDVGVDAQSLSPVSEGLVREMRLRPEQDGRH